jgi:hypothetical protein
MAPSAADRQLPAETKQAASARHPVHRDLGLSIRGTIPSGVARAGFRDVTLRSGTMSRANRSMRGPMPTRSARPPSCRVRRRRAGRSLAPSRPSSRPGYGAGMTLCPRITGAICRLAGSAAGQPARRRHPDALRVISGLDPTELKQDLAACPGASMPRTDRAERYP